MEQNYHQLFDVIVTGWEGRWQLMGGKDILGKVKDVTAPLMLIEVYALYNLIEIDDVH